MARKKPEPERRAEQHPGVFPYQTKGGTFYRYQFDVPPGVDGKRKVKTKRGFRTEEEASRAMRKIKEDMRLPGYAEPTDETLDQYFQRWMRDTQHGRRAGTNRSVEGCWKRLPESFRGLPLVKVTPTHVRSVYADLVEQYKPGTAKLTRGKLRSVLAAAHRERLIPYNPADGIPMKINTDAQAESAFDPERVWSLKEQVRFLSLSAHHKHHALWRLMLDGGLRIGEALALTWDDVDLEAQTVRVQRTVTTGADGRDAIGKNPKTPSSRREIDLQPETIDALRRHQIGQKERRLKCGPIWVNRNLVFDRGDGRLVTRQIADYHFKTAVAQMDGVRPISLHGLRHTMAVTWIKAGVEPVVVSKRLGHRDVAFTLNVYTQVSRDWQQSAVDRVRAFIEETG